MSYSLDILIQMHIIDKYISEMHKQMKEFLAELLWFTLSLIPLYITNYQFEQDRSLVQMIETPHTDKDINFSKGMTLEEYMNTCRFENPIDQQQFLDEKQQNLYESSFGLHKIPRQTLHNHYHLRQVEQQSLDDSVQSRQDFSKNIQKEQLTKATFRQTKQRHQNQFTRNADEMMHSTAYFNSPSDKNQFRIKNVSNSPYKKKVENQLPTAITLYGRKFTKSIGKDPLKIPEMVTFYGQLRQKIEEPCKMQPKRHDSKKNFKKKNHLQINELIKIEQRVKNNYSQKIYFQDIKIEGIKDKICERKNKLC